MQNNVCVCLKEKKVYILYMLKETTRNINNKSYWGGGATG